MSHLLHFAVVIACGLLAIRPLARARWATRMPRTALVAWQCLGLTLELSLLGLVFGAVFAPDNQGLVPGLLRLAADAGSADPLAWAALAAGLGYLAIRAATLALACREVTRRRRHHRRLLSLVAITDAMLPGVDVLEHPAPAAYCLPGRQGRIVLSTGALRLLDPAQLAAVISHERAHLRGRHDLVLLPLLAWRRILPRTALMDEATEAVRLLLEMCADDACCRHLPRHQLAAALTRFTSAGPPLPAPPGALAAADIAVAARTARLLTPPPGRAVPARAAVLALAVTALATPLSLFVLPLT